MIGKGVRDHYLNGEGFPSLVAVAQNATGEALERTLALAKGIGSTRMGAILSSFEEETVIDLFSEHLGGLYAIRRSFDVLIEAGYNPEAILLELYASGEGIAIAKATRDLGLWGQITLHSRTSQYGQEVTARLTPEAEEGAKERLRGIVEHIRSGTFAQEWQAEQEQGYASLDRIRAENLSHPMIQAEESLYRILKR
jgi:ketol-acid reductoisomerase